MSLRVSAGSLGLVVALIGAIEAEIPRHGLVLDAQASLVYEAGTGDVWIEVADQMALTSVYVLSDSGIFNAEAVLNLTGVFDYANRYEIFKAVFGETFGMLDLGFVTPRWLSADSVSRDLTLSGSRLSGGGLGPVDLIYAPLGDFDHSQRLESNDLDHLCAEVATSGNGRRFDINDSGSVDQEDVDEFLKLANRLPGDADWDGQVQFGDFVALATTFGSLGTWSHGDFDCDGVVQFSDFVILAANFGETAETTFAVSEPATNALAIVMFPIVLWTGHRARENLRRMSLRRWNSVNVSQMIGASKSVVVRSANQTFVRSAKWWDGLPACRRRWLDRLEAYPAIYHNLGANNDYATLIDAPPFRRPSHPRRRSSQTRCRGTPY